MVTSKVDGVLKVFVNDEWVDLADGFLRLVPEIGSKEDNPIAWDIVVIADNYIRSIQNAATENGTANSTVIALAIDRFEELAGEDVEAEFTISEIVDLLEKTAQKPCPNGENNTASMPLKIGGFELLPGRMPGRIWIQELDGGEGGDFKITDLAPVIKDFYCKHF